MKKKFICLVALLSCMSFAFAQDAETASDTLSIDWKSLFGDEEFIIEVAEVGESESSEFNSTKIIGHWALQEVQIPQDQEYEDDASFRFFDQLEFLYGVVNVIGYDTESWNFSINENRILTLSWGNRYQNFEVLILNSRELVLATDLTRYGRMIYKFVPFVSRKLPIVKSKHQEKRNDDTNPIVMRIPIAEVLESETPRAVAYNFVMCIVNKDFKHVLSYMDEEWRNRVSDVADEEWEAEFSKPGKLNILSWIPALSQGYEVAAVYVQNEGYSRYGRKCMKVYVDCVLSSEIGKKGFQEISRYEYNTNVKVLVVENAGTWEVIGFK